jgi:hypothetical protein
MSDSIDKSGGGDDEKGESARGAGLTQNDGAVNFSFSGSAAGAELGSMG